MSALCIKIENIPEENNESPRYQRNFRSRGHLQS